MPNIALNSGQPIVIDGKLATNCDCCSCYYLRPASCCDSAPGPVRYRVYGSHSLLDTFATSGDPLYIVLRPDGFALGAGLDYSTASGGSVAILEAGAVPTCWLVETSTECDEGEILTWIEFDGEPLDDPSGGEYAIGNIAEATVLYDDEFFPAPDPCEEADPDNCPVIICGDQCVSTSAVVSVSLTGTAHVEYTDEDLVLDGETEAEVGCAGSTSIGISVGAPDPTPYPSTETTVAWGWFVNCDGSGEISATATSWEEVGGVLRGFAEGTFDSDGEVTVVTANGITLPETVTTSWSVSSPVNWVKVGDECVLEEAP